MFSVQKRSVIGTITSSCLAHFCFDAFSCYTLTHLHTLVYKLRYITLEKVYFELSKKFLIKHKTILEWNNIDFLLMRYLIFIFTGGVYISGILSMMSCGALILFSILSIIQLAMITSRDKVVLNYKTCIICRLGLAIIAGIHWCSKHEQFSQI